MTRAPSVFDLPDRLAAKADPALIAEDERRFGAISAALETSLVDLEERLAAERRKPGGSGQAALERDLEIHRITARLRTLRRFSLDLCLGRVVPADGSEPIHIGRLGLSDAAGDRLLVDWRTPAAAPFFAATRAEPMGLASRRRYRWTRGRITDYWDEALTDDAASSAALDDESAFIASLGASRSPRMRDVLGTIQADQDAIIRAGSRGALVVDGGPGTGKTVVALHRAAYLLYSDPRVGRQHGGVLVVGPHRPYLSYVSDVLPSLGEEGVRACTLRDLVPEGAGELAEEDPAAARLKSSARLVAAVEEAVRSYERPPGTTLRVETPWGDAVVGPGQWADAFEAVAGTPHNAAREQVWEELLDIVAEQLAGDGAPAEQLRRYVARDEELVATVTRAWPLLDPAGVVADLWSSPGYLRACAPWLSPDEAHALQRAEPRAWTGSDLPLLDAARLRIGDPEEARRARRRAAAAAVEQEQRERTADELIAADDGELRLMSMLRGQDVRNSLADDALPSADPDALAGPFAHVVVDEAQELTEAEWLMLLRRCPSRSLTIVGDRAQARHGFPESWPERLARIGLHDVSVATLTITYRTPEEVMAEAEPAIRAALPDANVPTAIRRSGIPVRHGTAAERDATLADWLAEHEDGIACVIGDPGFAGTSRVASLSPELAKGLEFDLVVLVDPDALGPGIEGAVDRYVAMTRATGGLVILRPGEVGIT